VLCRWFSSISDIGEAYLIRDQRALHNANGNKKSPELTQSKS
jgi:hypothetical protein